MNYRLHLRAYDDEGRRLSLTRLRGELSGLTSNPETHGQLGTRYGQPGIWLERDRRQAIRLLAQGYARYALQTGYRFRYAATNAPTVAALHDLVPVERG